MFAGMTVLAICVGAPALCLSGVIKTCLNAIEPFGRCFTYRIVSWCGQFEASAAQQQKLVQEWRVSAPASLQIAFLFAVNPSMLPFLRKQYRSTAIFSGLTLLLTCVFGVLLPSLLHVHYYVARAWFKAYGTVIGYRSWYCVVAALVLVLKAILECMARGVRGAVQVWAMSLYAETAGTECWLWASGACVDAFRRPVCLAASSLLILCWSINGALRRVARRIGQAWVSRLCTDLPAINCWLVMPRMLYVMLKGRLCRSRCYVRKRCIPSRACRGAARDNKLRGWYNLSDASRAEQRRQWLEFAQPRRQDVRGRQGERAVPKLMRTCAAIRLHLYSVALQPAAQGDVRCDTPTVIETQPSCAIADTGRLHAPALEEDRQDAQLATGGDAFDGAP